MTATTRDRMMPADITMWNPRGCLVSVIDDQTEARQAAVDLREAGFGDDEIHLAPAREITEGADMPQRGGLFMQLLRRLGSFGDESVVAARYLDEARRGHHLLVVHALRADPRRRAYAIMARHRAHSFQYYGRWVITSNV